MLHLALFFIRPLFPSEHPRKARGLDGAHCPLSTGQQRAKVPGGPGLTSWVLSMDVICNYVLYLI